MTKLSADVVQELLDEMARLVVTYPERVERTGRTLDRLVAGTAFFPGGTGLWRGKVAGGPLPKYFPEKPVMLVAHNFGNPESLQDALKQRGEAHSAFATLWTNLLGFLDHAGPLHPSQCFFTNALMGLKPDERSGKMPSCQPYEFQCLQFFAKQIEIVQPRAIVLLGGDSATLWRRTKKQYPNVLAIPAAEIMHPSARPLNQKPTPELWKIAQGAAIAGLF